MAALILEKVDFRTKKTTTERTLYNYKRAIHQKDMATLSTYAPNNRGAINIRSKN